jgi:ABC-type uncharacterized transport system permease subunit
MKFMQFFAEDNGNLSGTRLMAFEVVNAGIFIAVFCTIQNKLDATVISLSLSMIATGLTAKLVQKPFEENMNGTEKK